MWASTPAWFWLIAPVVLFPLLVVSPQSPSTSNVSGPVPPVGWRVVNCGDGFVPSRSAGVAPVVVTR